MNSFLNQAPILVVLMAAMWIGPVSAICFLRYRKRRSRAARRSPINGQFLREPGHTLRRQIEETRSDLYSGVYEASLIPTMLVALTLWQARLSGTASTQWVVGLTFLAMALVSLAYTIWTALKDGQKLDRLRAGLDGEIAVGQELNRLMLQGAIVFHDVPGENFNIDHVVVCTSGVFAIETKGHTKINGQGGSAEATVEYDGKCLRFPIWTGREPLEQANRQAAWLSKWLTSATGSLVRAQPIVALPGWFVKRTGRGEVWVYSGKELGGLPKARGGQALTTQDIQRVSHQLEQRCRTVAPMLAEVGKAI